LTLPLGLELELEFEEVEFELEFELELEFEFEVSVLQESAQCPNAPHLLQGNLFIFSARDSPALLFLESSTAAKAVGLPVIVSPSAPLRRLIS
jgi:hypothetical protein